jgi:hypothetical protein
MPKKSARRTVVDLATARQRALPEFTPDQLKQVRLALKLNEKPANGSNVARLSARAVLTLLREDYEFAHGETVFERMVCKTFKRRSWVRK